MESGIVEVFIPLEGKICPKVFVTFALRFIVKRTFVRTIKKRRNNRVSVIFIFRLEALDMGVYLPIRGVKFRV